MYPGSEKKKILEGHFQESSDLFLAYPQQTAAELLETSTDPVNPVFV